MAYRRRQQLGRGDAGFFYNHDSVPPPSDSSAYSSSAAKAVRASSPSSHKEGITAVDSLRQQLQNHTTLETQLKASRDVSMAMSAKAKLLMRELKTFKADLAFAKDRCSQLEDENRILRECRQKGDNPNDDDLVRLQLESLLGEKARLAQENSVYARENRFLREIVEYHQLSMQDVAYFDEGSEEVYPIDMQPPPTPTPPKINVTLNSVTTLEFPQTISVAATNPYVHITAEDVRKH